LRKKFYNIFLTSDIFWRELGKYYEKRNATQRNATQRNATQRNATQRNATQRNAKAKSFYAD
jgi:nucleoside 2-deoxyribosyltransferase